MSEEEHSKHAMLDRNKDGEGVIEINGILVPHYITAQDMSMREHGIDLKNHLGYWVGKSYLFLNYF